MRRKDVLDLDDFTADELREVLETTAAMKEVLARPIRRVPPLRGKTIVNCFYEASTRTRVSFELAAKNLSADVVNITASGSSVEKGETLVDTTRTRERCCTRSPTPIPPRPTTTTTATPIFAKRR